MTPGLRSIAAAAFLLVTAAPAAAQDRAYVFGTAGYGSHWDDEGSLGRGPAGWAGGGWHLGERLSVEGAVGRARHEREGPLSWRGDPLTVTARLVYRFGAPASRARIFLTGGAGYFRYPGTFTQTLVDSPRAAPRTVAGDWLVQGRVVEIGTGVDIRAGRRAFVRPEAWFASARGERTGVAPEPPYWLPRLAVSAGLRF